MGIEDYERKTDEATGLRGEIAKFESRIRELRGQIEELEGQIKQKDLDNQELSQSLTMARRHSQQTETRVADLRARTTDRQKKLTEAARRVSDCSAPMRIRARGFKSFKKTSSPRKRNSCASKTGFASRSRSKRM